MKINLFILPAAFLLLFCFPVLAQTDSAKVVIKTSRVVMSGAELKKVMGDVKFSDKRIYDKEGNIIDSAEAARRVKTYEYVMGFTKKNDGEYKRMIFKLDPHIQAMSDSVVKLDRRPKSPKLQEGQILDLKPLNKFVGRNDLEGKAVLLIFWCDGCFNGSLPNAYAQVNEVLSKYKDPEKLEILTITHHPIEVVSPALTRNPIVNTRHIIDAGSVTEYFQTENRPIIVLTDKSHKIVYAIKDNALMTPRWLDKLFREIL